MGKRTSDFIALAAIVGGAGLGLGLSSLFAQSRTPQADDSSARVRVMRRSIIVEPGRVSIRPGEPRVVHEALIVEPERLKAQVEELRRGAQTRGNLERWYEALDELEALERLEKLEALEALGELEALENLYLGELEALENLDLGEDLTIELLPNFDDERRRRRRRRRPRRVAEVPNFDAPGN